MALVIADRVRETTTTTGTGTITLAGAVTGYTTFSAAVGNANTCYYTIADQGGANWEVGLGTYTTSGNTLSRDSIIASSNSGSAVNFTAGTKDVFVTIPGSQLVTASSTNTFTNKTITGLKETKTAPSISTGVVTVDCSAGNVFAISLNAAITSFTLSNIPASGTFYGFVLEFTADGTARSVTWTFSSVAVKWAGGTAPTLTSTNAKKDSFGFYTYDAGTTWIGVILGQNL